MVFGLRLGLPKKAKAEPPNASPSTSIGRSPGKSHGGALTVNEFVARTKRCKEKGLEPTKPELIAYARYLGIDPISDGDLMWIADEALNAPLPYEWTEHHDSADRVFYYNVETHGSSWTHPLEQLHRDTYKAIVSFRSGNMSKDEKAQELERMRCKCEIAEGDAHKELQTWTEHVDDQGQRFYYNKLKQQSVWTDPRPARCHALYLQMKALRVLSKHCGQSAPRRPGDRDAYDGRAAKLPLAPAQPGERPRSPAAEVVRAEGHRRKKKHRDRDRDREQDQSLSFESGTDSYDEEVGFISHTNKAPFELKKPNLASVDEVRNTLGIPRSRPHRPFLDEDDFLSPGENLHDVGHVKVRAGTRLPPLKRAGA
mmetsp:Transcript_58249/g.125980  ORF Transcript_58249/g.125980 Transcript_58249/m.125980 type:complete len:369 (-) Transcript_58249:341-1447(-)